MSGLAIVFHLTARLSFDGINVAIVIVFSLFKADCLLCTMVKHHQTTIYGICLSFFQASYANLGGGFKDCLFSPSPGEMIQFD